MLGSSESSSAGVLQLDDRTIALDQDMMGYLRLEAERRGISMEEVYREEKHFDALAQRDAFTTEELRTLIRIGERNTRLPEGDEECPF
jgi:hypothetical protein